MTKRWWVRVYAAGLRLFPRAMREDCREEILATLEDLLDTPPAGRTGGYVLRRALLALPGALARSWVDENRGWARALSPRNWRGGGMDGFVRNLRFAGRSLRTSPAFAWTSILLVGLGVGAVTTIFTMDSRPGKPGSPPPR